MSAFSTIEHSETVLTALEELAATGDPGAIDRDELQRLIVAIVHLHAVKAEAEGNFPLTAPGVLAATEVMLLAGALLKAANVNVFELGLWQSWSA
jgi:hypothetical protein